MKCVINDCEVMSDNDAYIFNFSLLWTITTLDTGIL